jgi:hypothetical protein
VNEAIESQSALASKILQRVERRRPNRLESISPQLVPLLRDPIGDGLLPNGGLIAKGAPANDVTGVTPERQIMDFLLGHRARPFCDDCLKQQVHPARRPEVPTAAKAIGAAFGFRKVREPCSGCGKAGAAIKAR